MSLISWEPSAWSQGWLHVTVHITSLNHPGKDSAGSWHEKTRGRGTSRPAGASSPSWGLLPPLLYDTFQTRQGWVSHFKLLFLVLLHRWLALIYLKRKKACIIKMACSDGLDWFHLSDEYHRCSRNINKGLPWLLSILLFYLLVKFFIFLECKYELIMEKLRKKWWFLMLPHYHN